jgi:NADH-quinone oxidoreductase subunit L
MEFQFIKYIALIPLLGVIINGLWGNKLSKKFISIIGCGTVFISFVLSFVAFIILIKSNAKELTSTIFSWINFDIINSNFAFKIDSLSSIMTLVITFVGFWIHVYSIGYMWHDKSFARFFTYLNLFIFFMLTLVLADNLLLLFVGWEGVGLCSYLLIGFWYEDKFNATCGRKAFIVNRIGDLGFILGIFTILYSFGVKNNIWTLDFSLLEKNSFLINNLSIFNFHAPSLIALFLFIGATGKSAQIPLYVWLPDAMAGPTPVSALIHAATMVTAGVFMIARMHFIYFEATAVLHLISIIGILTAILAATIAITQNDIKKVLAYSTISQLGYMFCAMGIGAFASGIFHLVTHAFFKALLFLGAGSVIHGLNGEQNMQNMGGLSKKLPWTYKTFLIGTLAIAGVPPLSGFFSKDEILWNAFISGSKFIWVIGFLGALLTSFYMMRLLTRTFYSDFRGEDKNHIHECPLTMKLPLIVLGGFSIIAGIFGIPHYSLIEKFLSRTIPEHEHVYVNINLEIIMALFSSLCVILVIYASYKIYTEKLDLVLDLSRKFKGAYKILINKYFVDEIYNALIIKPILAFSRFCLKIIDLLIIDGSVNGLAFLTSFLGKNIRRIQTGNLHDYGLFIVLGLLGIILFVVYY